jgi:hypothetical protein
LSALAEHPVRNVLGAFHHPADDIADLVGDAREEPFDLPGDGAGSFSLRESMIAWATPFALSAGSPFLSAVLAIDKPIVGNPSLRCGHICDTAGTSLPAMCNDV